MGPLYLNTLYLQWKWVLSTEAAMFVTVAHTGQTKHLLSFYDHWFSFMFGWGGWGEGHSAAICNFTTRCHKILHWAFKINITLSSSSWCDPSDIQLHCSGEDLSINSHNKENIVLSSFVQRSIGVRRTSLVQLVWERATLSWVSLNTRRVSSSSSVRDLTLTVDRWALHTHVEEKEK